MNQGYLAPASGAPPSPPHPYKERASRTPTQFMLHYYSLRSQMSLHVGMEL